MRRALPALVALVAVTAVTAFLFHPLVWGALSGEPRFFEWDVPEQYWPDLVYLCGALHEGELPLWNPHDRFGYPYLADPQAGTWSPLNWGICAAAGPAPGPGWAVGRAVFGFWLMGALGLGWLRGLRVPWAGAITGAALLQVAPFMRHNWELNLTLGLALAPLVLWCLDRLSRTLHWRDGVALGLAWALCAWVGSPPALWQVSTFAALYGAWRMAGTLRARGRGALLPAAASLGAAAAVGALLTAMMLVPALTLAEHSVQAGRSLADIAAEGLDPSWLAALVWPRAGNHLYLGLLPLALGALALVRRPRLWPLAGIAALAVLLALGEHTPVFALAYHLVPGVDLFRLPHRYEAWLGLAAAPLLAWGVTEALDALRWPRWELTVGALLAGVVVADAGRALPPERHTRAGVHPGTTPEAVLSRVEPGARVFDEFGISCRAGTRLGLRDARGYQDPLLSHSTERVWASLREHPDLLEQYGVRYALTGPHFIHGWNRHYLPPPEALLAREGARDLGEGVIELSRALPDAYWRPHDAAFTPVPATGLQVRRDSVTLSIHAPADGVVVVNEAWYPGWTATVDGVAADVEVAHALVRAVAVPAGRHRIEMHFRPWERHLRWLWLAGWLVVIATAASGLASRRRGGGTESRDRGYREETTDQTKDTPGGSQNARSASTIEMHLLRLVLHLGSRIPVSHTTRAFFVRRDRP